MWLRQTFIEIYKAIRHPVYRSHPRIGSGLTLRFHEDRGRAGVYSTPRISAIFLLNSIRNRATKLPGSILSPELASVTSAAYTSILCLLAIWLYRRQDVG